MYRNQVPGACQDLEADGSLWCLETCWRRGAAVWTHDCPSLPRT